MAAIKLKRKIVFATVTKASHNDFEIFGLRSIVLFGYAASFTALALSLLFFGRSIDCSVVSIRTASIKVSLEAVLFYLANTIHPISSARFRAF